jgi:putative intracellular protease/amidase
MQSCYFTAVDDDAAVSARVWGTPPAAADQPVVEADGVITVLAIPRLLALAAGREPVVDLAVVDHLWPRMPADPQADLSWMAEPIVERLSPAVCEELAAVDLDRAPELAARWAPAIHWPVADCERLVRDLVSLARAAREQGRPVYSRYTL